MSTPSVNALVGAVFVLSVKSFADRIAHIEAEMARHGIAFEFVFEHDAVELDDALLARRFAPSDMTRPQQSLVLKHLRALELAMARGLEHFLVFEDDAVLAPDFAAGLAAALDEARRLPPGWLVYLGRGNNRNVGRRGDSALMPGELLPATEALLLDRASAERRLAYLATHRITRPADWLYRELDVTLDIPHYWLRRPLVEQGSMNGTFDSVLDTKRQRRGRRVAGWLYRWHGFWRQLRRDLTPPRSR